MTEGGTALTDFNNLEMTSVRKHDWDAVHLQILGKQGKTAPPPSLFLHESDGGTAAPVTQREFRTEGANERARLRPSLIYQCAIIRLNPNNSTQLFSFQMCGNN